MESYLVSNRDSNGKENPKWGTGSWSRGEGTERAQFPFFKFRIKNYKYFVFSCVYDTFMGMLKRHRQFIDGLEMGLSPTQSAKRAKYTDPRSSARDIMKVPEVAEEVAVLTANTRKEFAITRSQVQAGIAKAINMAELQADPMAMIRGWQEVNKMCGYYAPEEKRITLTSDQSGDLRRMQTMPLNELIDMADGEIIEAELLDDPEELRDLDEDST